AAPSHPSAVTPALSLASPRAWWRDAPPPNLHSFPTRRSSDLATPRHRAAHRGTARLLGAQGRRARRARALRRHRRREANHPPLRSEEHTSELQSRENLVCRLLLEKKKQGLYSTTAETPPVAMR